MMLLNEIYIRKDSDVTLGKNPRTGRVGYHDPKEVNKSVLMSFFNLIRHGT